MDTSTQSHNDLDIDKKCIILPTPPPTKYTRTGVDWWVGHVYSEESGAINVIFIEKTGGSPSVVLNGMVDRPPHVFTVVKTH